MVHSSVPEQRATCGSDQMAGRRIGVFAGAGFSKALFNIPIQSDFAASFCEWSLVSDGPDRLSSAMQRLLRAVEDIELILSHQHNLAFPLGEDRCDDQVRALMFLRSALALFLETKTREGGEYFATREQLFGQFLAQRGITASDLFVVTTNYDLAVEHVLDTTFGLGSYWYPSVQTEAPGIPVFKLHGSLNWMENRGSTDQVGFARARLAHPAPIAGSPGHVVVEPPSRMTLKPSNADAWGYSFEATGSKYIPILVPFLFQKDEWLSKNNPLWSKRFEELFTASRQAMSAATTLFFFGYGLPAADHHLFSLLLRTLEGCASQCEIVECGETRTNLIRLAKLVRGPDVPISKDGLESYLRSRGGTTPAPNSPLHWTRPASRS